MRIFESRIPISIDSIDHHRRWLFPILSVLIAGLLTSVFLLGVVSATSKPPLPVEFRLIRPKLSGLPVEFSDIRSCSCWHGPRDEAQRKYKFRVVNRTDKVLNIGGGVGSVIRLIVAYPRQRHPVVTMPASGPIIAEAVLGSPPHEFTPITDHIVQVKPDLIRGANDFFGVPSNYRVWALPASPNKVAEVFRTGQSGTAPLEIVEMLENGSGHPSYPTEVGHTELLPGEEYAGHTRGHGTWSFYIPIPRSFAEAFEHAPGELEWEPVFNRQTYERYVIFVGVAAMEVGPESRVHLLGFAPAPSENALVNPRTL
jgi:hypothetical protein